MTKEMLLKSDQRSEADYIGKLMDMLDNPEAYSEKEIRDFIDNNEDVREAYNIMADVRQSYRFAHAEINKIDVEEAWQRFEKENLNHKSLNIKEMGTSYSLYGNIRKYAAIIIAILLISGISYAAFIQIRNRKEVNEVQTVTKETTKNDLPITATSDDRTDTLEIQTKTFDNVPLCDMLTEIAHYYDMDVIFHTEESKSIRMFFTWNPQESVDKTIIKLNQFERLSVKRDGDNIIVE